MRNKAFNLRLPPALDAAARLRAEPMGISLNALMCVALNAYLQAAPGAPVVAVPGPMPGPSGRQKKPVPPAPVARGKLSKAEKTRLHNLAHEKKIASLQGDLLKTS